MLYCSCISFSLVTRFSRCFNIAPSLAFLWIAARLRMVRNPSTRYRCLELLKLRAAHADTPKKFQDVVWRQGCTLQPSSSGLCQGTSNIYQGLTEYVHLHSQSASWFSISSLQLELKYRDQKSGALSTIQQKTMHPMSHSSGREITAQYWPPRQLGGP